LDYNQKEIEQLLQIASYHEEIARRKLASQMVLTLGEDCDREKVEVLFITVPQSVGDKARIERYNALNKMIRERGYKTLCLEDAIDEIGLDLENDYYNAEHTNIHGSVKYTDYLSQYLVKNYGFADKRENKKYADWNKTVEEYRKITDSRVFPWETDISHRDYSLSAPKIKLKSLNSKIDISWNKVSGADGYVLYRKTESSGTWKKLKTTDSLNFSDKEVVSDRNYYYAVVPYKLKDGQRYYGNCYYHGKKIQF